MKSPESNKYGISHILVNTLYYCKRKNTWRVFYLVPRAASSCWSCYLIVLHCLSGFHAIPVNQDSKICDTKQSITERNQIDKNQINMFQLLLELSLLLHISFHLKNRLRLTELNSGFEKLEDKLSFIDRSQAIECTKESTHVL